jgi:heterodisulfide reductase subunit B2
VVKLGYYPGCTLKTKAHGFETSMLASAEALDIELQEVSSWNCCGTVYSLANDDLVHYLAPLRNLIRARKQGIERLATLCSFCYNTLERANLLVRGDEAKRKALVDFLDEGVDYRGEVEVVHMLEVLRDGIGFESLSRKVKVPLQGLKVASYYGCALVRPTEIAIDNVESPTVLGDLVESLGGTPVNFPWACECCGSYQVVSNPSFVSRQARDILNSAMRRGADAVVTSCPLCSYNLGRIQSETMTTGVRPIPVLYFSQLLALALGLGADVCRLELNPGNASDLLKSRNVL